MYVEMMNQDLDRVTDTEIVKAIRAFREQKAKEEENLRRQREEREREERMKQQRMREDKERQRRLQEREEKEFQHRLRDWEDHERAREAEFSRRERQERERLPERRKLMDLDDLDDKHHRRRIRSREARRERLKEFELDERQRREVEQAEAARRAEQELLQKQKQQQEEEQRRALELQQQQLQQAREQEVAAQIAAAQAAAAAATPVKVSLANATKQKSSAASVPVPASSVFGDLDDDASGAEGATRRKRPFIQFSDAEAAQMNREPSRPASQQTAAGASLTSSGGNAEPAAKRQKTENAPADSQTLIDKIPQDKQELFKYPIKWDVVKETKIVQNKMRPWVAKKMVEFLGEEEGTLVDFVCEKLPVLKPTELISQLQVVLEEESEVFVVKLYRMLIFEMIRAQSRQ